MNKITVLFAAVALTCLVGCSKAPDPQQIKTDLIGQTIESIGGAGWQFVSLDEIQQLTINNKNAKGDALEYDVDMALKDIRTGQQYRANLLIAYRKNDGAYKMAAISRKSFEAAK